MDNGEKVELWSWGLQERKKKLIGSGPIFLFAAPFIDLKL